METITLLQHYWWLIISLLGALLVFLLFVQGGQGLLYCLGRTEEERNMLVNSLGRKWEFTFTTLVTFGGAFFASFPLFYSTSFGGEMCIRDSRSSQQNDIYDFLFHDFEFCRLERNFETAHNRTLLRIVTVGHARPFGIDAFGQTRPCAEAVSYTHLPRRGTSHERESLGECLLF